MIIFIATTQENSQFIEEVASEFKDTIVLHPFYSFTTEVGLEVFNKLPSKALSPESSSWNYILEKDVFCIKQADIVIYDLDNLPNEGRYLVMAAALNKTIVGVSETLKSISVYFSGSVLAIIKPKQTASFLKMHIKQECKEKKEKNETKEVKEIKVEKVEENKVEEPSDQIEYPLKPKRTRRTKSQLLEIKEKQQKEEKEKQQKENEKERAESTEYEEDDYSSTTFDEIDDNDI